MDELLILSKQCLSIISTATIKDREIQMLIRSAILDLKRQGIDTDLSNELVKSAIIMFVKGNFGNADIKEKELAQRTYSLLCNNLSLSSDFKESDSNA